MELDELNKRIWLARDEARMVGDWINVNTQEAQDYAHDIAAAWELVDEITSNPSLNMHLWFIRWTTQCHALFTSFPQPYFQWWLKPFVSRGETAPEAICKAWLQFREWTQKQIEKDAEGWREASE